MDYRHEHNPKTMPLLENTRKILCPSFRQIILIYDTMVGRILGFMPIPC